MVSRHLFMFFSSCLYEAESTKQLAHLSQLMSQHSNHSHATFYQLSSCATHLPANIVGLTQLKYFKIRCSRGKWRWVPVSSSVGFWDYENWVQLRVSESVLKVSDLFRVILVPCAFIFHQHSNQRDKSYLQSQILYFCTCSSFSKYLRHCLMFMCDAVLMGQWESEPVSLVIWESSLCLCSVFMCVAVWVSLLESE